MQKKHSSDSEYLSFEKAYRSKNPDASADKIRTARQEFECFLRGLGINPQNLMLRWDHATKNAPQSRRYQFNPKGQQLLFTYFEMRKDPIYRDMRRGKFSPKNIEIYQTICDQVLSNMRELKKSEEECKTQILRFWKTIGVSGNNFSDYLIWVQKVLFTPTLTNRIKTGDISDKDMDDLIIINERIRRDFRIFQRKWERRITQRLSGNQKQLEQLLATPSLIQDQIIESVMPILSAPVDTDFSKLGNQAANLRADKAEDQEISEMATRLVNKLLPMMARRKWRISLQPTEKQLQKGMVFSSCNPKRRISIKRVHENK